jgi:hypothetical protein
MNHLSIMYFILFYDFLDLVNGFNTNLVRGNNVGLNKVARERKLKSTMKPRVE